MPSPPDVAPGEVPPDAAVPRQAASPHDALRTESVRADLPRRALLSGAVSFAAQPVKLVIGAVAMAVLARLLSPADFGLIAMVLPLVALVKALLNLGTETAIVQREDLTHDRLSTIYWWTLALNGLVLLGMAAVGPVLAWFYNEPALVGITAALAGGYFVFSFAMPHEALLMRQMRFEALTALQLGGVALGVGTAIVAALLGAGYWALVLELVVPQVVLALGFWAVCGWRPGRPQRRLDAAAREMAAYGGNLTGFRLISRLASQLDRVLIGYVGGASVLGLYAVAARWGYLPIEKAYQPLSSVAVASFCRAQGDPARYRALFRGGILPAFAFIVPALLFAWIEAGTLLLVFLGPQWGEAVPFFRILLPGFLALSVGKVTKWLYMAEGTTRRQLRWGLISTPVQVAALLVGGLWGALGIAWALTASTALLTPFALAYCFRASVIGWPDLAHALWRPVVAAAAGGLALVAVAPFTAPKPDLYVLLLHAALFGLVYAVGWFLLPGGKAIAFDLLRRVRAAIGPAAS